VWAGKPKTYPFSVEVKAQSGEAQTLSGEVLVRPSLPMWALPALGIFLCFLASVGLFLIYPRLFPSRTAGNEATATYLAALVGTATSPPPLLQPSDTSPAPATTTIPVIIPTQAVATEAPAAPIGGIVFATNRDGNWEIYLQDNDGNLNRLTHDSGDDSFPVWSPDGSKILFHSDRAGNYDIYVMNPDGSGVKRLTNDSRADTFASWSADGEKIAFQSKREGPKQIYVMNADGSDQTRLTHSEVDEQFPSWSPDGRQILYSSEIHGVLQLSIMNADGSEQRQLTHGAESYSFASWSPDGRWIVAAYATEDKEEIILAELLPEGTLDVTGLTDSPGKDTQPRWSLDGKYIYFTSNRNGNFDIYRMDADGSNVVWLLVDPPDEEAPSVFP
jgi:TolB protein